MAKNAVSQPAEVNKIPIGTVGVIGAGSWGTTVAHVAARQGNPTLLWARRGEIAKQITEEHKNERYLPGFELAPSLRATTDLQEVADHCDVLFLIVPTKYFRNICQELGKFLRGDHVVIHGSKGLEQGTHTGMCDIIREETCVKKVGVLSGPNLAKEVMEGRPTGTVVASRYDEVIAKARRALADDTFRIYSNSDIVGVELGGTLKNIFAIASGLIHELNSGDNARSLLITRGLAEMSYLGKIYGAEPTTFGGLAGIGDMMATCFSPLSRNYQVGMNLAKGKSLTEIADEMYMVAEGVNTTRAVYEIGKEHGLKLPIIESLYGILFDGQPSSSIFDTLLTLRAEYEVDGIGK